MIYVFWHRSIGEKVDNRVVGVVCRKNGETTWIIDRDDTKKQVYGTRSLSLGGFFDENNDAHWRKLPSLFSGSLFWCVVYENDLPDDVLRNISVALKGGKGSGFYGHVGRPGKRGGSQAHKYTVADLMETTEFFDTDAVENELEKLQVTYNTVFARGGYTVAAPLREKVLKLADDLYNGRMENHRKIIGIIREANGYDDSETEKLNVTVSAHRKDLHQPGAYDPNEPARIRQAITDVTSVMAECPAGDWKEGIKPKYVRVWTKNLGGASYFREDQNRIYIGWEPDDKNPCTESIATHEFAHWIEANRPGINEAVNKYFASRVKGEQAVYLGRWQGTQYKDKFIDPYMGRVYFDHYGGFRGTELFSMALESLLYHPKRLYTQDRELFDFTLDCLRGKHG